MTRLLRLLLLALVCGPAACAPAPAEEEADFLRELEEFRAAKDLAFQQPDSPIVPEKRTELLPLSYYPPSTDYRVPAVLGRSPDR